MPPKPKEITTAADRLYDLVKREKEIPFKEAAKRLKVSVQTIEAWATFLEEDGILSIKYKFTTPYVTMPVLKKSKSKEYKEPEMKFQDKLVELEVKSDIEKTSELLDNADESRSNGEFGALGRVTDDLLNNLQKIGGFLVSRMELSPQRKTQITKELSSIEKQVGNASKLLKSNKFDEANTAYSELHVRMKNMLEKTRQQYTEVQEETSVDEKSMQKLLENTYNLLAQGKLEEAEENYDKIKQMFGVFSHKFVSERSEMQDNIVKLNRDLAVSSNKIKNQRLQEGTERINQLLKLTNQSIKRRQFPQATAYYMSVKKIFEWLPHGFLKEKRRLKEEILKVFAQIAKEREERLHSKFNLMAKQINGLLKDVRKQLGGGELHEALKTYKTLAKIYAELPRGFMKEKFDLQKGLVAVYNVLSVKLESSTEREIIVKTQKILGMLTNMEHQIHQGSLDAANRTYSEINSVFKRLPAGFISRKTELQGKIIDQYEKLLEKKDENKSTTFKNSAENLDKMVGAAYGKLRSGNYSAADDLYKQIKAAYVKLQPTDIKQRESIRNRILALYRRILMASPSTSAYSKIQLPSRPTSHESMAGIHKRIGELKSRSRAQVRLPA